MDEFTRPRSEILPGHAAIPAANLMDPAPNHFTHVLERSSPYFYRAPPADGEPDGELAAGTQVLLIRREPDGTCRVADPRGLLVLLRCEDLRPI